MPGATSATSSAAASGRRAVFNTDVFIFSLSPDWRLRPHQLHGHGQRAVGRHGAAIRH
jgi:hypothetical protein